MIICSHSNIDIIQGVIGYGDVEGITDWRISNTSSGILNIFNSTFTNAIVTILENSNVGIGITNPSSVLDINGDANITGVYKKNNRDVINDTSNYVLSTSNIIVPRILTEVGNGSNYVSRLTTDVNTRVDNTSNYVLATSNILVNRIVSSASGGSGGSSQWTNVSSGIYYNTSNVGIGTINPISDLHIYDETINITKVIVQNNMPIQLPADITIAGTTLTTIGSSKCIQFPYTGTPSTNANTTYTFTTTAAYTIDILIVGGGGAGGQYMGGGGGAGGVVYATNLTLPIGTYSVRVGRGGIGLISESSGAGSYTATQDGVESSLMNSDGTSYISFSLGGTSREMRGFGGGGGGAYGSVSLNGRNGGSGGGSTEGNPTYALTTPGTATQPATYLSGSVYVVGGTSGRQNTTTAQDFQGGGGGGLGGQSTDYRNGNAGVAISITGTSQFYAAGGGAGQYVGASTSAGIGGSSIGGNGRIWTGSAYAAAPRNVATSGANGTGSGGGGGSYVQTPYSLAGSGGSGIVIIRYSNITSSSSSIDLLRGSASDINMDYKLGNYNGEFKVISSTSAVDTDYIRITSTGAIFNPTGSSVWSTTSDRRIKENIEEASYDKCYDNINNLGLYRFNYIDGFNNVNKDIKQLGFIAQEVKDIFPKAVVSQSFNNDELNIPDLLTIDISQINYSLYGAVKKLIEMCNDKKKRLIILNNMLNIEQSTSNLIIEQ